MLLKILPVALVAAAASVSIANAQSRPPAELPPPGFSGQQYVDSRGCLYIRAGHGGQVNWVARIDRARKPICGQAPTSAVMAQARRELAAPAPVAVAAAPVRAAPVAQGVAPSQYVPPPVTYGKPMPLRAATASGSTPPPPAAVPVTAPRAAPLVVAHDRSAVTTGGHPPLVNRHAGCPDRAPHGHYYALRDGRTILLCSNSPKPVPNVVLAGVPGIPADGPVPAPVTQAARVASSDLMTPPPGYKAAWRDDRLNPNRARGSAEGNWQMRQVWTDEVPQTLRDPASAQPRRAVASSKGVMVPQGATGARFVQVGSFGVAQNAARAVARLQAMGLPVQVSRGAIKGKPVQIVRAGPFASEAQAASALQAARGAGFGDAILRR